MKDTIKNILDELIARYPILTRERENIEKAYELMRHCYETGGKLLVAGNGGSSADSEHITGELMKGFKKKRPVSEEFAGRLRKADPENADFLSGALQGALPAIDITGHKALNTAFSNDVEGGASATMAQQIYGYARPGDVFLGISTSGNSRNVLLAAGVARALRVNVIGLTGRDGGKLREKADVCIIVPEDETFKIQELHLPVYHALCLMLEETFFPG